MQCTCSEWTKFLAYKIPSFGQNLIETMRLRDDEVKITCESDHQCNQGTFETRQGFRPPKESKGTNEASNVRFLFTVANRIYVLFVARCAKIGVRG